MNAADDYAGRPVNSGACGYAANELWYLMGTAESFRMYSHVAGMSLALTLDGLDGGAAATLTAEGTELCLTPQPDGSYAISPKGNVAQSFNMYGGNGQNIRLYDAADNGSKWTFRRMDTSRALTLVYKGNLEGGYAGNSKIGEVAITVDGVVGTTLLTKDNLPAISVCYLPEGAEFSVGTGMACHGWTMDVNGAERTAPQPLPAEGLTVEVNVAVDKTNRYQYLYHTPDAQGKPYRIPAIATAPNGTIFAISDNRPCGMDIGYGEVDIKCRISNDNGETWGEEFFIADGKGGNTNAMTTGYGDAAVVADREQNRLLVMMVCGETVYWHETTTRQNPNRIAVIRSSDNGRTWSQWEEITESVYTLFDDSVHGCVQSCFVGSGKILQSRQIKVGSHYRIYAALCARPNGNRVIYSDDFGRTWKALGGPDALPVPNGDEPKCEELPDGRVVISSRAWGGRYFNIYEYTDVASGAGAWGEAAGSGKRVNGCASLENACNGELLIIPAVRNDDGRKVSLALQSVPLGPQRANVGIYYKELPEDISSITSESFAADWEKPYQVSETTSAYSTMLLLKNGNIAFYYEESLTLNDRGYDMVYKEIPLETITSGRYK